MKPLALLLAVALSGCAARYSVPVAAGADIATTEIALSRGFVEANPLMQERGWRIGFKVAVTGLVVWACEWLEDNGHPKAAAWLQWTVTGVWAGAATWNTYQITR